MAIPDLHIIHFAVPYPPDYGGAIDSWNRLKALKQLGVRIGLHCFVYAGFKPQPAMKDVVQYTRYYPRQIWPALFAKGMPYMVSSRKSPELYRNLKADQRPVLFDGIHTTAFFPELSGRKRLLRAHNVENQYYRELSRHKSGVGAIIYARESACLEEYEERYAPEFDAVFAISPGDRDWFAAKGAHSIYLPPFHGFGALEIESGHGQYVLYQGDLSLDINQTAVLDLLQRLPAEPIYPFVVAGRSGNRAFEQKLASVPNLRREADVTGNQMNALVRDAHIILIHSLHGSGMKLKFFPALFMGKFIMASATVRTHTALDQAFHFYAPDQLGETLKHLWQADFTNEHLRERAVILSGQPDDMQKAAEITRYL